MKKRGLSSSKALGRGVDMASSQRWKGGVEEGKEAWALSPPGADEEAWANSSRSRRGGKVSDLFWSWRGRLSLAHSGAGGVAWA